MAAAKESQTCQQFTARNSSYLDHMALAQLDKNFSLPYFPPYKCTANAALPGQYASDLPSSNIGQQVAVSGFRKPLPPYCNILNPTGDPYLKDSQRVLPHGLGVVDKPVGASFAPQRRFLIFDQSENHTRLFFSPALSPLDQIFASKAPAFANGSFEKVVASQEDQHILKKPIVEEKWDENHVSDGEGEMLEDSDEIDALLYSDSDDDDDDDDDSDDSDEIEEEDDDDASDDSDSKDDQATPQSQILLNKVSHKGTTSSKKKKAKLQHISPSMKHQQRLSSEKSNTNYCSPLNHLKDAEVFCKNLFSRLQSSSNESFEVRMMMIGVIAQTVGLKKVILLDFYSYLEKYAKPDKRHVTTVLAAAVQACHKEVPRLAVEPLFNQIKYEFVEHECRREVNTVGMNAVREMHHRMPELMIDAIESKEKKREFSDLNAANISLGAMKKLMRKPIKFISYTSETYVVDKGHYASFCMLHNRTGRLTKEQELACDRNEYFTQHLPGIGTLRHRWVRWPYTQEGQPAASEATIARTLQEKNASEATIARTRQEKDKKRKHSGKQFLGRKAT